MGVSFPVSVLALSASAGPKATRPWPPPSPASSVAMAWAVSVALNSLPHEKHLARGQAEQGSPGQSGLGYHNKVHKRPGRCWGTAVRSSGWPRQSTSFFPLAAAVGTKSTPKAGVGCPEAYLATKGSIEWER